MDKSIVSPFLTHGVHNLGMCTFKTEAWRQLRLETRQTGHNDDDLMINENDHYVVHILRMNVTVHNVTKNKQTKNIQKLDW